MGHQRKKPLPTTDRVRIISIVEDEKNTSRMKAGSMQFLQKIR